MSGPFDGVQLGQDLRVAPGPERAAAPFEVAAKLVVVVDLAVEDDHVPAVGGDHRLGAVRAVDDRQPGVGEPPRRARSTRRRRRGRGGGAGPPRCRRRASSGRPDASVIRPAMPHMGGSRRAGSADAESGERPSRGARAGHQRLQQVMCLPHHPGNRERVDDALPARVPVSIGRMFGRPNDVFRELHGIARRDDTRPVPPTISGASPASVTTQSSPQAMASPTALGKPSRQRGQAEDVEAGVDRRRCPPGGPARGPGRPARAGRRRPPAARGLPAGPSPTTTNRASGSSPSTFRAASSRTPWPFAATSRPTVPITGCSAATPHSLPARRPRRPRRAGTAPVSMPFGTTSNRFGRKPRRRWWSRPARGVGDRERDRSRDQPAELERHGALEVQVVLGSPQPPGERRPGAARRHPRDRVAHVQRAVDDVGAEPPDDAAQPRRAQRGAAGRLGRAAAAPAAPARPGDRGASARAGPSSSRPASSCRAACRRRRATGRRPGPRTGARRRPSPGSR